MYPRNIYGFDGEPVTLAMEPHSYFEHFGTREKTKDLTLPKKINFDEVNGRTILHWKDGSKTVVVRCKDNKHDRRVAFLTAYFQKHCGLSKTKANEYLAKLEEGEVKE